MNNSVSDRVSLALEKCEEFGLTPLDEPMGDRHHTEAEMSETDEKIGSALAWFLGGLFVDVHHKGLQYWDREMTSIDQWSRVARALRIHGLRISNADAYARPRHP